MIRLNRIFGRKDPGPPVPQDDPATGVDARGFAGSMAGPDGAGPDSTIPLAEASLATRLHRAAAVRLAATAPVLPSQPPRPAPEPVTRTEDDWDADFEREGQTLPDSDFDPGPLTGLAGWPGDTPAAKPVIASPPQPVASIRDPGSPPTRPAQDPALAAAMAQRVAMAQQHLAAAQRPAPARVPVPAPVLSTASTVTDPDTALDLSALSPRDPGQATRRAGRVKTRLLGFDPGPGLDGDPIAAARAATPLAQPDHGYNRFPVGWIVVVRGPGKGAFFALFNGVSQIGRGDDQGIRLDFGDSSISRSNHAAVAYDDEQNAFFVGHGGKANMIRLNDRPVISTEPLHHHDLIRIGETTLRFVALCDDRFRWTKDQDGPPDRD